MYYIKQNINYTVLESGIFFLNNRGTWLVRWIKWCLRFSTVMSIFEIFMIQNSIFKDHKNTSVYHILTICWIDIVVIRSNIHSVDSIALNRNSIDQTDDIGTMVEWVNLNWLNRKMTMAFRCLIYWYSWRVSTVGGIFSFAELCFFLKSKFFVSAAMTTEPILLWFCMTNRLLMFCLLRK